jgi:hypothetical protein
MAMRKAINSASPNMNNIQSKMNGQMDWPAPAAEEKTKIVAGVLIYSLQKTSIFLLQPAYT